MTQLVQPPPHTGILKGIDTRWRVRELVMLGVFAAAAKVATLAVALVGGGMNPVSLMAKNAVFTTLLVVLLCKVRKSGTLSLFMAVNCIISTLLLGGGINLLVPTILGALIGEAATHATGGMEKPWGPFVAAGAYDLVSKVFALVMTWLVTRENPALVYLVFGFVTFGYFGSVLGLFAGWKTVKELRRAGLARY